MLTRVLFALCAIVAMCNATAAQQPGEYFGELVLKARPDRSDGKRMTVGAAFGFVDSTGRRWEVPEGTVTDGASIPRALWTIVGSPFTGKYVAAAVIHDRFCVSKYRSWMQTHDVFYEAMLASGVGKKQALLMWAAAYRFGPRWARAESQCWTACASDTIFLEDVSIVPDVSREVMEGIKKLIEAHENPSKEDVEKFIDQELTKLVGDDAPLGARMMGFVSDQTVTDGPPGNRDGRREFFNAKAPGNWMWYGQTEQANSYDSYTWKVVRVKMGDTLRMRRGPTRGADEIGGIPSDGSGVKFVQPCRKMWCKVAYQGRIGWVDTSFLAVDLKSTRH